jgi:hypothetical protein
MDGGGRCQQSELGRLGTDRCCTCAFCTESRIESKFGECSRCAAASDQEPSTSAGMLRSASSVPVPANSLSGEGNQSLLGHLSNRSFQTGESSSPIHANSTFSS